MNKVVIAILIYIGVILFAEVAARLLESRVMATYLLAIVGICAAIYRINHVNKSGAWMKN